jgi:2'-5' RNA ligase
MNTFNDFIIEAAKVTHEHGTYVSVNLNKESSKQLDDWSSANGIKNPIDPNDFHATVIYSRKGVPEAKKYDLNLPIDAKISGWKIFQTQDGKNALVGIIESKELNTHHKTLRKEYGATHDYPEYSPHVTLSYDYGDGKLPETLPNFKLTFDSKTVEGLDPKWNSKKED